jgi:hypothetical protein
MIPVESIVTIAIAIAMTNDNNFLIFFIPIFLSFL